MPRDEEVHLDLAILMVKALFDVDVQGAHNSSLWGNVAHSPLPPAADKKLFCQTLSRLYLPDGVDENKLRTLKFLMNSFKQVRYSALLASLPYDLGYLLIERDVRTDIFQTQLPRTRSNASTSYWRRSMLSSSSR